MAADIRLPQPRVLLVGEGNLSFALAMTRRCPKYHVLATTFDERDALLAKFKETRGILQRLAEAGTVRVLHGIDASNLSATLRERARHAGLAVEDGRADGGDIVAGGFDCVVFNNPHLGVEDVARHRRFVAHFLHEALAVTAPRGEICVTLCDDQPERWGLVASAQRCGLTLRAELPFCEPAWPGYEHRRHHAGRSFPYRVSRTFVFVRVEAAAAAPPEVWPRAPPAALSPPVAASAAAAAPPASMALPAAAPVSPPSAPGSKRRKLSKAERVALARRDAVPVAVCAMCGAGPFATVRSLQGHVFDKHFQALRSEPPEAARCATCAKEFACARDLENHRRSQHSGVRLVHVGGLAGAQGETARGAELAAGEEEKEGAGGQVDAHFHCAVCDERFVSEAALRAHRRVFQPVDVAVELRCKLCAGDRLFPNERALTQHRLAAHAQAPSQ